MQDSLVCRALSMVLPAVVLASGACAPSVPLDNRPCPCADDWICCPSDNLCAKEMSSCPSTLAPSGNAGSGALAGSAGSGALAGNGGNGGGSTPDAGANPSSDAGLPTLPDPPYTIPPTLLGTWNGYFENFTFPSTSDVIQLALSQNPDGSGRVSVVLGMGPPPTPATDPAQTWPPRSQPLTVDDAIRLNETLIEGFVFGGYEVSLDGERLRFVINNYEPWQPYCQLQTSYFVQNLGGYSCVPSVVASYEQPDGTSVYEASNGQQYSIMQEFACDMGPPPVFCACNSSGCGANVGYTTSFDITFAGSTADGNVLINGGGHDVKLTQAASPDGGHP